MMPLSETAEPMRYGSPDAFPSDPAVGSCLLEMKGHFSLPPSKARDSQSQSYRDTHSMQVTCFQWHGQTLGKPGHKPDLTRKICDQIAGSVAPPIYSSPIEVPYIRGLDSREASQALLARGGHHGED